MQMRWLDLAFIHYPVPTPQLRAALPPGLELDEFNGRAWLGVVPFQMADVRPRLLPLFPGLSTFPEVNLRTYVTVGGKPGVWFFSLDADSWPTVFGGRHSLKLPYHSARMTLAQHDGWLECTSARRTGHGVFRGQYRPRGDAFLAQRGTFEHWATERYCLYSHSARQGLARLEVHHPPWSLQPAEVKIEACTLFAAGGLREPTEQPLCHFSAGVDVVAFGKVRL